MELKFTKLLERCREIAQRSIDVPPDDDSRMAVPFRYLFLDALEGTLAVAVICLFMLPSWLAQRVRAPMGKG